MDKLSVASCVITGIIVYTIYIIITYLVRLGHLYKHASKFDGPPSLPILGNAHLFIGDNEAILDRFIQLGKIYPAPYRLWLGHHLLLIVSTPEQMQAVLHSPNTIQKSDVYELAKPWVGTGLLTAPAEKWRVHRKLIQPTFHTNVLQSFVEVFDAQSITMVKKMEKNLNGPEFNIDNYLSLYFLSSIYETNMGMRLETEADSKHYYTEMVGRVTQSLINRCVRPWVYSDFIFYRTQRGKEQQQDIKILHDFTSNAIKTRQIEIRKRSSRSGPIASDDNNEKSVPRRKAFLDHLMELSSERETLSFESVREEVDTMIAAGYDTSMTASSFAMLILASHPEIQETVYKELYEIYGEDDIEERHICPKDLKRMKYLDRVIKETLRIFPVVPVIARKVTDDLEIDGRTFPKGSEVFLGFIQLHRNPDYWPDPFKFDPDRFLPEEVAKRHPYAYLPFSAGPRSCIGLKYAMMSTKTLLSTVLRRYILKKDHITPLEDIRLQAALAMHSVDPFLLRIEKRTRKAAST